MNPIVSDSNVLRDVVGMLFVVLAVLLCAVFVAYAHLLNQKPVAPVDEDPAGQVTDQMTQPLPVVAPVPVIVPLAGALVGAPPLPTTVMLVTPRQDRPILRDVVFPLPTDTPLQSPQSPQSPKQPEPLNPAPAGYIRFPARFGRLIVGKVAPLDGDFLN